MAWLTEHIEWQSMMALGFYLVCWLGYTWFSAAKANNSSCLASELGQLRLQWMQNLLKRDNRVPDTTLIANLERNVTFFASSTVLVIAGLLTALAALDEAVALTERIPWADGFSVLAWELKLIALVVVFVMAFFKFSWSLRQVGFSSVMVGAAPMPNDPMPEQDKDEYGRSVAEILSLAGNQFNLGLRSYYFGLAALAWFINDYLFMVATVIVVIILYYREFHSHALAGLVAANQPWIAKAKADAAKSAKASKAGESAKAED